MARFWTCHWRYASWRDDINSEYGPVCSSGSNSFRKRGVGVGDTIYAISLSAGLLYLGGRMTVKRIVSREEAVRLWDSDSLYDAEEWVVDPERAGTPLHLHRLLAPELTKQLRFVSKGGAKEACFISETELDNQATRGVRELTPESAVLLDRVIKVTDRLPRSEHLLTVTEQLLRDGEPPVDPVPAYLLTWNPAVWNDEITNPSDWSCGNNKRIKKGERLFLLRQGAEPRGMVASGWADSDVFEDDEGIRRVSMRFDRLPEEGILFPRDQLVTLNDGLSPPMDWSIRISGTRIPNGVAARLEKVWEEFSAGRSAPATEISPTFDLSEGTPLETTHNVYERNPEARRRCLEHYGYTCAVCAMSFGKVYGSAAEKIIHVHHLKPLSEATAERAVDPVADLRPVCPNCHEVLHAGGGCRSIEDVKGLLADTSTGSAWVMLNAAGATRADPKSP